MKYQVKIVVTIDNPDLESNEAQQEAERIAEVFCRIKNQNGCEVSGAKLMFSVVSGAIAV